MPFFKFILSLFIFIFTLEGYGYQQFIPQKIIKLKKQGQNRIILTPTLIDQIQKMKISWFDFLKMASPLQVQLPSYDKSDIIIYKCLQKTLSMKKLLVYSKKYMWWEHKYNPLYQYLSAKGLPPNYEESLDFDEQVISDLWQFNICHEKGIYTEVQLKQILTWGKYYLDHIYQDKLNEIAINNRIDLEYMIYSILWYLEALSGEKVIFNFYNWNFERSFVVKGVIKLKDPLCKLVDFLLKWKNSFREKGEFLTVYERPSSHFKYQRIRNKHNFGFDFRSGLFQLPGKRKANHLLFDVIEGGYSFFKVERVGYQKTKDKMKHGLNYIKYKYQEHKKKHQKIKYLHRENVPSYFLKEYKSLLHRKKQIFQKSSKGLSGMLNHLKNYKDNETINLLFHLREFLMHSQDLNASQLDQYIIQGNEVILDMEKKYYNF